MLVRVTFIIQQQQKKDLIKKTRIHGFWYSIKNMSF